MKRPLTAVAGAFVLGEVMALCKGTVDPIILLIGFISIILMSVLFWRIGKSGCYLLLPLFLISGYLRALPEVEAFMKESSHVTTYQTLSGEVTWMEQKTNSYLLYMKTNSSNTQKSFQILIYLKENPHVKLGNQIHVSGEMTNFPKAGNPGQFDSYTYYKIQGISYQIYADQLTVVNTKTAWYQQQLFEIKSGLSKILSQVAQKEDSDLYHAILLGDKNNLSSDVKTLYQRTGIAHLLAISGLHISILGMGLYSVLRKCRLSFLISSLLGCWIMVSFGIMTGEGPSIRRALIMFLLHLLSDFLGRTYDMTTAVSMAGLVLFLDNPLFLLSSGVQLSFTAIIGISVVSPLLIGQVGSKFRQSFLMSFAIQLLSLPIIIFHYYEYPPYGILINLLVIPFMSLCVYSGMLALFFGWFSKGLGSFWIGLGHYILEFYDFVCKMAQRIPGSTFITGRPGMGKIFLYYVLVIIVLIIWNYVKWLENKKNYKWFSMILLLFVFYGGILPVLYTKPSNKMEMTFLDVGQGDGIFIRTIEGKTYLIDGGSVDIKGVGGYRIVPFLKYKGIGKIDYIILTHMDSDHISGIQELLLDYQGTGIKIEHIVLSKLALVQEAGMEIAEMAEKEGIRVLTMEKGDKIKDGEVVFTCLHPASEYKTTSDNDGSIVLDMEYGSFRGLFTGDLEREGEDVILQGMEIKAYTLLKVGHHGSKTSSSEEFLSRVKPNITVISCGEENRFGHPHGDVMERLEKINALVYRTDENGAITVETDGKQYWISEFLPDGR